MTDHNPPISALRQRMLEDMQLRKLAPKTHSAYIGAVKKLISFLHRSPVRADAEDLRRLQLHLATNGTSPTTINATLTGLRFFFAITLERPEVVCAEAKARLCAAIAN
jgi:integrase/recombinase XerD